MRLPVDVIAQAIRAANDKGAGALAEEIMKALETSGWAVVPASQTDYGSFR